MTVNICVQEALHSAQWRPKPFAFLELSDLHDIQRETDWLCDIRELQRDLKTRGQLRHNLVHQILRVLISEWV